MVWIVQKLREANMILRQHSCMGSCARIALWKIHCELHVMMFIPTEHEV